MDKNTLSGIYLAPLQGLTDSVYRNNLNDIFGGVDKYFAPYISYAKQGQIRNSQLRDILPENNESMKVIPQVLFSNVDEFRELCKILVDFGYQEINLNMGCPYPMVTNRGRGSALLQRPDLVTEILEVASSEFSVDFSIKLRSGLDSENEIIPIMEAINRCNVSEVIFHPRIARQMYKGTVNVNLFQEIKKISVHPLIFNGDILSVNDVQNVKLLVPEQNEWMIGRGVLRDPFLPSVLKKLKPEQTERREKLLLFHDRMFAAYSDRLEGSGHILQKMEQFWDYFAASFTNPHKVFKLIKKAGSIDKYNKAVHTIFSEYAD